MCRKIIVSDLKWSVFLLISQVSLEMKTSLWEANGPKDTIFQVSTPAMGARSETILGQSQLECLVDRDS